ncbi:MAG: hypothetical protein Q9177_001892 [Variospora cf. flavescens]
MFNIGKLEQGHRTTSTSNRADDDGQENAENDPGRSTTAPMWKRIHEALRKILFSSQANILLVFVPIGIACRIARVNPTIIFAMNAVAIVPLAGLLSTATESAAHRVGDTPGALINVSFGNAVELIIFDTVKARKKVLLVSRGTAVVLLFVYGLYLLFQLKSHAYMYKSRPQHIVDGESDPGILQTMDRSRFLCGLPTSGHARPRRIPFKKIRARLGRKRHTRIEPDIETEEDSGPLPPQAQNHDSAPTQEGPAVQPSASSDPTASLQTQPARHRRLTSLVPPVLRRCLESTTDSRPSGSVSRTRRTATDREQLTLEPATESKEAPFSKKTSILLLLGSTALVALCAEFMVGSIGKLVENTPLSEAFVGLIILPIVGNAAEHVTAVTVAKRNKMDLAIGVAIGSSIQIALFITPVMVLIGWWTRKDMPLYFTLFETVTLFVATLVVNFLVLDGRSNYLEGALLCSCYIIIAVATFFFPDVADQSKSSGPPGERLW